jgi:hypothetical protein
MASSCVWFPIPNPAYIIVGLGVGLCDASAVIQRKMYRVDTGYCVNANVGHFGISRDPEIAVLMHAMLRAREVVAARPWSTSQETTTEHWWADALADPRARIRRQPRGLYGRDSKRTARKSHYRLADEPSPLIEVACSKCDWKAAFSRAELLSMYGGECPLPTLLNHLAMPGCSKINTHWDRCGVYYVNPIDGRER